MKFIYAFAFITVLCFMSCSSSKSTTNLAQIEAFDSIINNQNFRIESDWAYPQNTVAMQQVLNSQLLQPGSSSGAINLIGNHNFLEIKGDSINSYLPYFGERQMQIAYGGGDAAIQFDGILENYSVEKNKNNSYSITFQSKSKSEQFNGNIIIYPSLKSEIILTGTSRFIIRYAGNVVPKNE